MNQLKVASKSDAAAFGKNCRSKIPGLPRFRATAVEILQPADSKLSRRAVPHEILRNEAILWGDACTDERS
jgi:hypothetical protein